MGLFIFEGFNFWKQIFSRKLPMKSLYFPSLTIEEDKNRKIASDMILFNSYCILIKIIKSRSKPRIFSFYIFPYRFHHDTSCTPDSSYFDNLHISKSVKNSVVLFYWFLNQPFLLCAFFYLFYSLQQSITSPIRALSSRSVRSLTSSTLPVPISRTSAQNIQYAS